MKNIKKPEGVIRFFKIETFIVGGIAVLSGAINAVMIVLIYGFNSIGLLIAVVLTLIGVLIIYEGIQLKKDPIKHANNLITVSILLLIGIGLLKVDGILPIFLIGLALSAEHLKRVVKKSQVPNVI